LRVISPKLAELAELHFGRKIRQPTLEELKAFYSRAEGLLNHPVIWFEAPQRQALVEAIGDVVARERFTCWACAVLSNHVHILVRKHRMLRDEMRTVIQTECVQRLHELGLVPADHPVFSDRACDVFKNDVPAVRNCIQYINANFSKHNLPLTIYPFITPYNDWPLHNRRTKATR